jgi:hypothetical protein
LEHAACLQALTSCQEMRLSKLLSELLLLLLLLLPQAPDGTEVPISLAYRKDLAKLDGTDPLLLHG